MGDEDNKNDRITWARELAKPIDQTHAETLAAIDELKDRFGTTDAGVIRESLKKLFRNMKPDDLDPI
jgi:hypothetical protein